MLFVEYRTGHNVEDDFLRELEDSWGKLHQPISSDQNWHTLLLALLASWIAEFVSINDRYVRMAYAEGYAKNGPVNLSDVKAIQAFQASSAYRLYRELILAAQNAHEPSDFQAALDAESYRIPLYADFGYNQAIRMARFRLASERGAHYYMRHLGPTPCQWCSNQPDVETWTPLPTGMAMLEHPMGMCEFSFDFQRNDGIVIAMPEIP